MPKIRDLGISAIPFARPTEIGPGAGGFWACDPTDVEGPAPEPCHPTPPQCHPTNQPQCDHTRRDDDCDPSDACSLKQDARRLPHDAVIQLRQQLQHQISRQLHG
jgi:hypothetical protein